MQRLTVSQFLLVSINENYPLMYGSVIKRFNIRDKEIKHVDGSAKCIFVQHRKITQDKY